MQETKENPKGLKAEQGNDMSALITQAIDDAKAQNIVSLKVGHLTSVTDHMIICSGSSNRHMRHLAETAMQALQDAGHVILSTEGLSSDEWMIVDAGDAVLHVMSVDAREFYHLEGLWDINESTAE